MPPRLRRVYLQPIVQPSLSATPPCHCLCKRQPNPRHFSTSPQHATRLRRTMFRWLQGPGAAFKDPLPGSTNYLNAYDDSGRLYRVLENARPRTADETPPTVPGEDELWNTREKNIAGGNELPRETKQDLMPFPLNRHFSSQPVLSEELREEIWARVVLGRKSVKVVSAELGVELNRIGAVVRLKTVEKEWIRKNKPLARPYARAVLAMLPTTAYHPNLVPRPHESINDLPVHQATLQQIFHPTSESRIFTRRDAAKVFDETLLPADDRIPHPELIELERERKEGVGRDERIERQRERIRVEKEKKDAREAARKAREERDVTVVTRPGGRWEFRFREIRVDDVGKDGRGQKGVGWRYGIPHEDRKKGQVKIPTRVG